MTSVPSPGDNSPGAAPGSVDLAEASRQLELAVHDARVSFDCIALGELERAQEYAITARAAADAAEAAIGVALGAAPAEPRAL